MAPLGGRAVGPQFLGNVVAGGMGKLDFGGRLSAQSLVSWFRALTQSHISVVLECSQDAVD